MAGNVFSGPRCRFYIDGDVIAYASGVSHEESYDYQPIDILDHIEIMEHVPVAYRCSLSSAFFRLVGSSLKNYQLGGKSKPIFPHLQGTNNILTSGTMSAVIEDKLSQANLAQFVGVRAAHRTSDVTAHGVVTDNVSFVAIKVADEADTF